MRWAGEQAGISIPAKLTLIGLAAHSNSGETIISRRRLAQWVGCSVSSVARSLRELETANLIARLERANPDGGTVSSRTVLNMRKERKFPHTGIDFDKPGGVGIVSNL